MSYAIQITETGGPEVLQRIDHDCGEPGAGEIKIRHRAIGLNFIDTYMRSGLYPVSLPAVLGVEGAGDVIAVGADVTSLKVGDRVAYCQGQGAYATQRLHMADQVVKLPDGVSYEDAASLMLQGLTVRYLLKNSYPAQAGDTVLWHAAAGGVGLIACQWARHLGVKLIGTAGSDAKCDLALRFGAAEMINYVDQDFVAETLRLTGGEKLPVVYDSVGKDTWDGSLDLIRPFGYMISYGNASGAVPPINIGVLNQKGALYVQRPSLFPYIATPAMLQDAANDLFTMVAQGHIRPHIGQRFALSDMAQAHRTLESRGTQGSTVITVD